MSERIVTIHRELWQDAWRIEAERFFAAMEAEGALPTREPISGGEDCIFAMAVTGQAWRPVGMATHYQPEGWDALWLDLLYVEPAYRRRGVARRLIAEVVSRADLLGLPRVEFGTMIDNGPMQALAVASGFGNARVNFEMALAAQGGAA
jgi:GNAT superfamily N-acetyltransferase